MSADAGLPGVLDRVAELARQTGLDRAGDLDAIRGFAAGPPVITVAAEASEYAAGVVALAESASSGATMQRTSLGDVRQPTLRDLLIVVTPADRALSLAEEVVVRNARASHCAVAVAVVEAEVFGDDLARTQAVTEIERLRLGPVLIPLAVPWFFLGMPERDEEFTSLLRRLPSGHERAARLVLDAVVRSMLDALEPRLAMHDEATGQWREADAERALVGGRLEHEARLIQMSVRRTLETAEQSVYQAGLDTAATIEAWLATRERADWGATEVPLREAWRRCLDAARDVVDRSRARFAAEVARLDPTSQPHAEIPGLPASWDTDDLRAAVASLAEVDLDRVLRDLRARESAMQKPDEEPSRLDRISGYVRLATDDVLPEGMREYLNAQLHLAIGPRMAGVVTAATTATLAGTRAASAAALSAFTDRLAARRAELGEQARWLSARAELAGLVRGRAARSDLLSGSSDAS